MRYFSRPASGTASGSTLSASVRLPVGASQSSQARPSTMSASRAVTAALRLRRTLGSGRVGMRGPRRARACHAGRPHIIVAMTVHDALQPGWRERAAHLAQALSNWPWMETFRTLRERFREDRLGLTASSLTFTTLIALVPLLTVMLAVFSAFPMFGAFRVALEKYFLQLLVPDTIARPVLGALNQFASQAKGLGSVGLIVLVLTAIALMLTIDRTLNAIWRVRAPRPIAQRVLVYWAAVTLGPLALGVSLTLTSYALTASQGVVKGLPGGVRLVLDVLE